MSNTIQQHHSHPRQISAKLSLIIFAVLGIFLASCASTAYSGSQDDSTVKKLSSSAEKELTTTDTPTAVVFSIDRKGRIQAFVPGGSKSFALQEPIKALITNIEAISIVTSKNPKVCWRTSSGHEQCVVW